jgi:hypothetical protein
VISLQVILFDFIFDLKRYSVERIVMEQHLTLEQMLTLTPRRTPPSALSASLAYYYRNREAVLQKQKAFHQTPGYKEHKAQYNKERMVRLKQQQSPPCPNLETALQFDLENALR